MSSSAKLSGKSLQVLYNALKFSCGCIQPSAESFHNFLSISLYSSGSTIDYQWYVQTREDVADFQVEVRPLQPQPEPPSSRPTAAAAVVAESQPDLVTPALVTKVVGYGLRTDRIALNADGQQFSGGASTDVSRYVVCIRARTSQGELRPWKPGQCERVVSSTALKIMAPSAATVLSAVLCLAVHFWF